MAEGSFPTEFGATNNLHWKTSLPGGVSSPCIWGERIFVTGYTAESKTLETICLDNGTGEILWRRGVKAAEIEPVHEVNSPANATPATDGTRVVVYFASYGLACYDLEGNELWLRELPMRGTRFGSGASPILAGDLVILNRDLPEFSLFSKSSILAVRLETGETAWETTRQQTMVAYSSAVGDASAGQVLLAGSSCLSAYNLADGQQAWWVGELPPQVVGTPIVVGDRVYLSATGMFGEPDGYVPLPPYADFLKDHDQDQDGVIDVDEIPQDLLVVDRRASGGAGNSAIGFFMRGLDTDADKQITSDEWNAFDGKVGQFLRAEPGVYAIRLGGTGDVSGSHVIWKETTGAAEVPSLLIYQDRLYSVRNGGLIHCRDAQTGQELFKGRLGPSGGYYASPVAGDGKIYLCSDLGVVTVLEATNELRVLARNDLGERIIATPALANDTLYVRTDQHLFAFREAK